MVLVGDWVLVWRKEGDTVSKMGNGYRDIVAFYAGCANLLVLQFQLVLVSRGLYVSLLPVLPAI